MKVVKSAEEAKKLTTTSAPKQIKSYTTQILKEITGAARGGERYRYLFYIANDELRTGVISYLRAVGFTVDVQSEVDLGSVKVSW